MIRLAADPIRAIRRAPAARTLLWLVIGAALLVTAGCSRSSDDDPAALATLYEIQPDLPLIELTDAAVTRIGVETGPVTEETVEGTPRLVVPSSAVLYHPDGTAWTYTRPRALAYVRAPVTIESLRGDRAILTTGPPVGTEVVVVGATELYGTELGAGPVRTGASTEALTPPVTVARARFMGESIDVVFERFQPTAFSKPTVIENRWLPLRPGHRLVVDGESVEDGETLPHRIEYIVTDFTKVIAGVRSRVVWIEDYSDDELVEVELAFFAQDDDGNVWLMGEYPEEYEDEEFVAAPTWIAGAAGARPGIAMYANPRPGQAAFEGWGPGVDWSDYAIVESVGGRRCTALRCYDGVVTVTESSLGEQGAIQVKSYAPGLGEIQVSFRGADLSQERLELVRSETLTPAALASYQAYAQALEAHAYEISADVYGTTQPMVVG